MSFKAKALVLLTALSAGGTGGSYLTHDYMTQLNSERLCLLQSSPDTDRMLQVMNHVIGVDKTAVEPSVSAAPVEVRMLEKGFPRPRKLPAFRSRERNKNLLVLASVGLL